MPSIQVQEGRSAGFGMSTGSRFIPLHSCRAANSKNRDRMVLPLRAAWPFPLRAPRAEWSSTVWAQMQEPGIPWVSCRR